MSADTRKKIYDILKNKTGFMDSYEDFDNDMTTSEDARKKVYEVLRDKTGFNDTYENFVSGISGEVQRESAIPPAKEESGNVVTTVQSPSYPQRAETKERILNNIPDYFQSKGTNLSTLPLPQNTMSEEKPADIPGRIVQDEQQRIQLAERAANDPYMKQQELEHVFKPKNQEQINTVRNLIEEQNKRLDKRLSIHSGSGNNAFNALANSTRYNMETSDDRNQKAVLGYAEKLIEQAQNFTDQAKKKGNTNFVSNLARGIRDTPLDVWAMGLADLRDYAVAKKVMDKVDKGEELNPAEDALMQALVTNAATQMYYTGDLGRGYKAGSTIGESLPFIADMLLGMGTIQAVTKPAAKSLLKYATEKAVKYGLGKATTGLAKGAARTISGLRDVAAHTATFGSQRVAADYLRRGLGDIQVKPNEDGTVSYDGRENIQTGGEAIWKAIVSTAAETGSELLGEYFGPMLGWIGRATGANRIGKIIPASVGKAYSSLVNSQGFKQVQEIARRAKIADPIGEYGEEVVNNLVSTAIGDMTPEQLVDLDNNIDTFLGVAPMSALFGAAGTGKYVVNKFSNYRNMKRFEEEMRETMGEDWSGVREALQDADIETAREMVKDVLRSGMQSDMKQKAIKYIATVLQEQTLQQVDMQMAPEQIVNEKKSIFKNLSDARKKINLTDEQLEEALDSSDLSMYDEQTERSIEEYRQAYNDYLNYTYWVQDQAYVARREAESQVERMTNATTGTVMRVKSGLSQNPVNILRGNIDFDAEGNVDKDSSDNTIYYLSEDGKVKMAPISMFESLVDDTPAEELAYQAGEDAEQEFIQNEEAQIMQPEQSVQPIELETTFQKDGVTYVVSQKSPDGYVVSEMDENDMPIRSDILTEEQLRTAMTPAIQEEQTSQEQVVQNEDVTQPEQQQAQTEPQTAMSRIPVNENGEHDFESAPYQDTSSALIEISENVDDAKDTATQMINHYQEELKKADKAKTTGNTIQEIVRLKQQKKANIQSINDKIAYWNSVANYIESKRPGGIIEQAKEESDANQQRLAGMTAEQQQAAQQEVQKKIDSGAYERKEPRKRVRYVNEDNEMGTANTPMEHVLREIATGRVTFKWNDSGETKGLGSHLGLASSPEERRRMIWALYSDGMTPEAAAEQIHADMPETLQGMVTDQDVFNMILESFQQYGTPSKMWEAAKSMHGTDVEESAPGYDDYMEQQALEWEASQNNMTVEEWTAYLDYIEEELDNIYSTVSDEELNAIFEQFYQQIISENESRGNETESEGSTEGQTDGEQGDGLLPEGRGNNEGADTTVNEQPEPANQADGESGGVVPEPGSEVTREKETYDGALNNGNDSVSSQNNLNGREHEQGEVAGVSGESGSLDGKNEAEAYLRRAGDRTTAEDGQSRWTRNTLLRDVVQRNKGHQTWIDDIQSIISGERIGLGGENDVYLSRDGKSVVKINDFSYLPENSTNFDSFMNRVDAHNELFPHDAITILGFTLNSDGKVSVVLSQPYISNAREATQEEIDNFLEEMGFYTDMSGNWTDGTYEIADTKPNNVLVDEDGNLHFIDVLPYDSRKPGKMLEIPAKRNAFVAPDIKKGEDVLDYIHRVAKAKEIHDAERETDTNPTEAQKEAGNYKKGHVKVDGFDITIENPKGSVRSGKDADGKEWSVTMNNDYGYIRGTEGVDGDHIDVFLSDNPEQGNVYVIDQVNQKTGEYDESKVMYGFNSLEEAKDAYLANFEEGWKVGVVSGVSKEEFRKWIESSVRKTKPFSEYKNVDVISTENDGSENNILHEENVVVVSKMETTTNEEKLINQNKGNKKTTESKFLSESEYVKQKVDEDFKNSGIEDRQEWDESDESIDSFNKASDEYPDYISNLSDSGELQRIYDQSNIGEKIKIRESVEAAGYEINELIDTSKEKLTAKEKRNRKREARSKELMEKLGIKSDDIRFREDDNEIEETNERFNGELERWERGEMTANEHVDAGRPTGVLRQFMPDVSIILRQKVLSKSRKKHRLMVEDMRNLPSAMAEPIFIFKSNAGTVSMLTELQDSKGRNIFVAIELGTNKQLGHNVVEVNDILTIHGREAENIINPIVENRSLVWADKGKGLQWLSSAKSNSQAIANEVLDTATNIVRNFENPKVEGENVRFREADNEISDFAGKYNLNEKDVQDYADYMRQGNLNGASGAFTDIRRKVRIDNRGVSLGEFAKIFSPIRKELYEKFGNIDDLREQYVQAEMNERSMMEAARKRAEEAAEAERRRLQVFQDMTDGQLDEEYSKAVEANDESRMRDLVNEAARRNGYGDVGSEYQGVGAWSAPSNPGYESDEERRAAVEDEAPDVNVTDIANGYSQQPSDYFTNLRAYGNDTPHGRESAEAINKAMEDVRKGKKTMVKVYRAVPKSVKEGKLRNGDWVTPSRKYAEMHGNNRLDGDYRIIEQEVPASRLWWDGNDINEWGFDDGRGYAYRNTKNNRKLNDLITRDDEGNIIPLSQRFNARKADVRYRFIGEHGASRLDAAEEATTRLDNLATARRMEQANNDKKARIGKLRGSKPVELTGNEYKGKYELTRKSAQEFLLNNLRGEYTIADTGEKVNLSKVGAKKVTSHSMGNEAHLKSIVAIPQLLENAIFIEERANEKDNDKYDSYRYYVVGLKIGNEDYTARLTVGVKKGEYYYDHYLTEIEKGNLIEIANGFTPTEGAPIPSYTESKDSRLISLLQTNDRENARKIKLATGWERGTDGKWRYETPDFEYHPNGDARQNDKYKESDWYKELYDLEERLFNGETLTSEETKRFDELAARENEIRDNDKNTEHVYLDNYVKDDELFKAYPELKQTRLDFVYLPNAGYSAKYNSDENRITVNQAKSMDDRSVIAHEIQHAIQRIEGFANGSNTDNYRNASTSENVIADINSATNGSLVESGGFDNTPEGIFDALNRKTKYGTILRDHDSELDDVARKYGYDTIFDLVNDIDKFKSSVQMYRSEAGEVEARNVQERLNMTPEQRRKTLAEETEDVAREDQIFLYDSMEANSMVIDANQIAKSLNVPVKVINSIDEIPEGAVKEAIRKGRKVKGWYDVKTRNVYVYLPNATSSEDVKQTIFHEGVAHFGLRQLVGDERMDDFLDDIFSNVSEEVRGKIIETLSRYRYNSRVATEEYMASIAENGVDVSTWERIKQAFKNLLRRMGINIKINDNELKYILWRSAQNLDKNRPIDLAIDVAMQYNMGVGNYFREGESDGSREEYENSLKGWKYKAREAYQDSMLALKNLQEVIANVSGKPIKSFEDAYKAENQLSSKNTAEAEEYYEKFFKPMLEAEGKMMKNYGLSHKEIERYMMLAHGIERNVEMTFREKLNEIINTNPNDAQQFADDFIMERDRLRNMYSGYEYLKALSDYIGEVGDFSATEAILTSIDNEEHTDFQNDALEYVKDFESKYDSSVLWDKTNRATKETLKKTYESGMMDKDHFANVSKMFMYYVPLRGWNEKTAEDVYEYINSERSPLNSVLKSMKGRKSVPDEVMATIGNMAESAILQGNKNLMKQSFMNMVMNHPTDVATMRKAWYVYDQAKDEWTISMPGIQDDDTPEIISQKISDHEEKMKNLKEKGLATQKSSGLNIDYRILKNNISQHAVVVKNVGKDYVIYVNGNPRAAQAVNGLTNPDAEKNPIFNSISRANRWLAANFTTRNPAFVMSNLARDMIFSMSAIGIKEDAKYSARFRKNLFVAIPTVFDCIRGKCKNSQSGMYFKEFVKNGGETGYMHLNDVDKYKKKVKKELSKITGERGSAKAALDYALDRLEDFNRWAEDVSRFAVYMTSRQMGRSIVDSVNDAKEVTVNFNKKGAGYKTGGFFGITAGIMRNLYLFFNASVQSLSNFNRLRVKNPVRFYSTLGGFIAAGVVMPVINNFLYNVLGGGDDNPYNDLPEWVRRNNLCIYAGNGQFVTIPLPIELRAFYGLGDYAYQLSTGREKPTPTGIVKGTVSQLADLMPLNPTGNEGLKTFMPDALSPIFETYVWNKDFTGKPIAKLTPFNERDPEWKRVYKGTSGWLVDASKFFNDLTNGGGPGSDFRKGVIDFNPAKVENLFESYFGGMAKFLNQSGKTIYYGAKSLAEGEMDENLVARNVPIVNRFYNKVDDRNAFYGINTEYFNLRDEMEQFKYELNGVKRNYRNNPEEYRQIVSSDMFRKYMKYKPYQDRLDRLYKMVKELEGEERKQVEDMIIETRRELVNSLK